MQQDLAFVVGWLLPVVYFEDIIPVDFVVPGTKTKIIPSRSFKNMYKVPTIILEDSQVYAQSSDRHIIVIIVKHVSLY